MKCGWLLAKLLVAVLVGVLVLFKEDGELLKHRVCANHLFDTFIWVTLVLIIQHLQGGIVVMHGIA
jgi:hypothetical protein